MKKLFIFLTILLLMLSGILLLCMIVKADPRMSNGIMAGKLCWFHTSVFCLACSVLVMEVTVEKSRFTFSLPDCLLLFLFGVVLFTYDKEANLAPDKLLFLGQLTLLWFLLRSALQTYPFLKVFYLLMILFSGMIEAVWGLYHFYAGCLPVHRLFDEIDYAFRSGPLCNYLAVVLPVSLNQVLRFHSCWKRAWFEPRTQLYYFYWISLVVISISLIGSGNRPALFAGLLSCLWIIWMRRIGWESTKRKIHRHRILLSLSTIFLLLASTVLLELFDRFHEDYQTGRLLMWNVTTKAILEHPFTGTGLGSYAVVYARTQESYLSSGSASSAELLSAGFPNFAYNDYLHIGLELGIVGLVSFLLWIVFSLYYGIKHHQMGSCGGILSMGLLSMYSYPLQLPSFWVLLIFLTSISTTSLRVSRSDPQKSYPYVGFLAALFACVLYFLQRDMPEVYREWKKLELSKESRSAHDVALGYRTLYPLLYHNADFLKEGADCLNRVGEYSQAEIWLERALELSADPELSYEMAFTKRKLGKLREAERYLQKSRILSTRRYQRENIYKN